MVAKVVVLALGAAFFPALLACVAILVSRPEPHRLILAFYLGGLLMSVTAGLVVLKVFQDGGGILGSDSGGPDGRRPGRALLRLDPSIWSPSAISPAARRHSSRSP
jgi:hypothetical protein